MIFETVRSEALAHFSYVVGDEDAGVCAVIDPRRDVEVYLDIARRASTGLSTSRCAVATSWPLAHTRSG